MIKILKFLQIYIICLCISQVAVASILPQEHVTTIDSLLNLGSNSTLNPNVRLKNANLALNHISAKHSKDKSTYNYVTIANIYFSLNDKEKFLNVVSLLDLFATTTNDLEGVAWSSYLKGNYYYKENDYLTSYYNYSKAEKASLSLEYHYLRALILSAKADILNLKKDYINAEINATNSLQIALVENDNILVYKSYISLGNSLLGLKNFPEALSYFNLALLKSETLKKDSQFESLRAQAYNYLASVYSENKDFENALIYANEGLKLKELKVNGIEVYCYLKKDLSYAKFKLNQLSSDAEFLEILKIGDSINSIPVQLFTKMHLAEYHLVNKNVPKALRYGTEARALAHKAQFFEEELKILLLLSEIDASKSLIYTKRYIALNDSLLDVERASRNKFARIEFETEEITAAKNTAEEKNTFLENRIWVISGFGFLGLLVIVLWFRMKSQKSKTRQLLLEQKQQQADEEIYQLMLDQQQKIEEGKTIEKQRISLDLHDNVMGKLSAIRMNLYPIIMTSEIENKSVFYDQLNDIRQVEKEIRGVAHDLNANLFAEDVSFIAVVKEFFIKIKLHTDIHFNLQMGETIAWESISSTVKINLYRIIQEALQNIEKYADAKNVSVTMSQIENQVYIVILDDGIGFDTNAKKEGIGLQNMKTRMDEINGTFAIQSKLGAGTKISLIIPV